MTTWIGEKSKLQRILDEVQTRFGDILYDNGYNSDIGQHVFDRKPDPWSEDDVPGVNIEDFDKPERLIGIDLHQLELTLTIITNGEDSPENLRALWADIQKSVGVDITWGGLADDTHLAVPERTQIAIGDKVYGGMRIVLVIEYATDPRDPYN